MLKLGWNASGRIDRRSFREATGRMGWTTIFALLLGAVVIVSLTRDKPALSMAVAAVVTALVLYLQYRYAQLSIQRLHDRGLSGYLYAPILLIAFAVIVCSAVVLEQALLKGGVLSFFFSLLGLIDPLIQVFFYKGFGVMATLVLILYNLFISWNLHAPGQRRDNGFGPQPETAA